MVDEDAARQGEPRSRSDFPGDRVQITRVIARPPELRPSLGSARSGNEINWLLEEGRRHDSFAELLDAWCWRLVAIGVPLARVTVNVGTLHPQLIGFAGRWTASDGRAAEVSLQHGLIETEAYRRSPFVRVYEHGETVRRRLEPAGAEDEYPVFADLKALGATDYLAMPLLLGGINRNAATFASDRSGGFSNSDIAMLTDSGPALSIVLELMAQRRISQTLLDVYLGRKAGSRVLAGDIVRGSGESTRAVIWSSDLRNFTRLTDRLPGERIIALLNRVFDSQVAAIHAEGGEVLKFIGDGLIAIFPVEDVEFAAAQCERALRAARAALLANDALNEALAGESDAPQLKLAVALHVGDVFFGNIGGVERLDFTVIGPAVNAVSRLEKLTKVLDRNLLVTGDFAESARRRDLIALGTHPLRGISEPVEVFGLAG